MKRALTLSVASGMLAVVLLSDWLSPDAAQARPPYLGLFFQTFPQKDQNSELAKAKCNICHLPDKKDKSKDFNYFALDLKSELKKKNSKTLTKDILIECAKGRSDNGKTYKANIDAKKLPATK